MPGEGFDINVTSNEVTVSQDGSLQDGASRGASGVIAILAAGVAFFFTIIVDKHGRPGLWHDFKKAAPHSFNLYFVSLLILCVLGFCGFLFLTGIRLFFPSGEQLQCNRTTLTYKKIPWISLRSRWRELSFPVASVSEMMYGVIKEGNSEKNIPDTYGLDFYVGDKRYKTFGGIEPSDANDVLKQLRSLGVDVIINQDMQKMIAGENHSSDSPFGIA